MLNRKRVKELALAAGFDVAAHFYGDEADVPARVYNFAEALEKDIKTLDDVSQMTFQIATHLATTTILDSPQALRLAGEITRIVTKELDISFALKDK